MMSISSTVIASIGVAAMVLHYIVLIILAILFMLGLGMYYIAKKIKLACVTKLQVPEHWFIISGNPDYYQPKFSSKEK